MSWGRNKPPARSPHPDPAVELELQRILDLRASIARRVQLIRQYRSEISELYAEMRTDGSKNRMELFTREIRVLDGRINAAEDAIARTGEDIAALSGKMSPDDLAFL